MIWTLILNCSVLVHELIKF